MLKLLQLLETNLLNNITALSEVRPISRINELEPAEDGTPGFENYAICHEIIKDRKYKGRKGKYETSLFLNIYSNYGPNADLSVHWLNSQVKEFLDEANLTDKAIGIKTYKVEYADSSPTPQFNERVQAWQSVVKVNIRWEEL